MPDLTNQITKEYEIEQKANLKAVNPEDLPISYEAVTPDWLTHVLCKKYPDARVIRCDLDKSDTGMTNRRRIFITYNQAGEDANLPSSVFCKATHDLQSRLQNAATSFIQGEHLFYSKIRPLIDIETPTHFLSRYNPVSFNSIIVFDDLVRHGAEFCTHTTEITRKRAESQMTLLAKLHGRFYQANELLEYDLTPFDEMFHEIDFWWNFEKICNDGFLAAKESIPAKLFQRSAEIWPATLESLKLHQSQPRTFTHNDTHLRNWYIGSNGNMGLSDWQCCGQGHWARDVAYTLSTSLSVENRRSWEKDLLQLYLSKLKEARGPDVDFDQAWNFYRQHLFSTLSFWTSTLAVEVMHPGDACLELIKRITTAIDDLEALDSFT